MSHFHVDTGTTLGQRSFCHIIDGNEYFVYTLEPYGSLIWGNMIKEHSTLRWHTNPTKGNFCSEGFVSSKRAPDFVNFSEDELIPFVENNYRTSKKDRTLGHSLRTIHPIYDANRPRQSMTI